MDLELRLVRREFDPSHHIAHINEGTWLSMFDADGVELVGIRGMKGVSGPTQGGETIGGDFVQMMPGSAFPPHVHGGEHEIYFISGKGVVQMDGIDYPVRGGHIVHIPGEYPHAVSVPADTMEPLVFVAVGHPHKHVDAPDRMRHPE